MSYITLSEFRNLDKKGLSNFINYCLPESSTLEYKQQVNLSKDNDKKEFAKDVSGMANGEGGIIVYGFDEPILSKNAPGKFYGIEGANKIIQIMEQVVSSRIEPRLPKIEFSSITYEHGKSAIVCWIANSQFKPHMSDSRFHKRNSETVQIMTATEVRQSVLNTYNHRTEIKEFLKFGEDEFNKYWLNDRPGFIFQALPLLELSNPWDVQSDKYSKILSGNSRNMLPSNFNLMCLAAPYLGIQCICGDRERGDSNPWHVEVSVFGHIRVSHYYPYQNNQFYSLGPDVGWLFYAFGHLLDECLEASKQICTSMIMHVCYKGASQTLLYPLNYNKPLGPSKKNEIIFPPLIVDEDNSGKVMTERYAHMLYNAYGISPSSDDTRKWPWQKT